MPGDGVKSLEEISQPLLKDYSMRHIQLNARVPQRFCWREPSSKLDFLRAQMIAGLGKQSRDFKPCGAEANQLGFEVRAPQKTS